MLRDITNFNTGWSKDIYIIVLILGLTGTVVMFHSLKPSGIKLSETGM